MSLAEQRITAQQYLEQERRAEYKSEYLNGQVFAMTGASRNHNLIVVNMGALLHAHLADRDCEFYANDMRVRTNPGGLYTYPDLAVVCGEPDFDDDYLDTLLNPLVVIEVLSPSTQNYDRGEKFRHYREIHSLREYLLVSQDRPRMERFTLQPDGGWRQETTDGLDAVAQIESIGCRLPLEAIYRRVKLASVSGSE